jgi:hypothetical protein
MKIYQQRIFSKDNLLYQYIRKYRYRYLMLLYLKITLLFVMILVPSFYHFYYNFISV